ncbi:hypothetical protein [Acaryochloris sp. CCMEE 5410]|uniref:hypothetical protein n=1 Tax=Acaryochloris sp. CCMEE 5410 TaxID=310037 RepID=UPI001111CCB4|nr:hypothetical protein [Acaryochloris sp. CCMEE 5410]KAI9130014.1 hypothetical protein ON05_030665 [Acaryochloris sp. CCMEE 5410]
MDSSRHDNDEGRRGATGSFHLYKEVSPSSVKSPTLRLPSSPDAVYPKLTGYAEVQTSASP